MKAEVDVMRAARDIRMTIYLKRFNEFRLRLWLGSALISLAARILPFPVSIEDNER